MYNPTTIAELLKAKEGEQIQFKEAKHRFSFEEATKCCCGLANCGGGQLVFGISDKRPRQVVGSEAFAQPERVREGLMDKLRVMVDFALLEEEGKRVLLFNVAARPLGLPVQVDGVAWWYAGDSLIPMPEEVRRKVYAETGLDYSSSICPSATMADLEEGAINAFREKWVEKSGNRRLLTLSAEQLLCDCEAITDDGVTYAALVLFGKREALRRFLPQAELIFEYRSTDLAGPANQRVEFQEGFFSYFDRLWELVNLRNDKQHYQTGFFLGDISTFNERVVREAILNAVSHRSYQMGGSVFVKQYRERLTVESPGGFPIGISLSNILNRQLPRNRRIVEILALCGLVERSGQGMNLMYELSVKEGKELPDFTGTDDSFVSLTLHGLVLDPRMLALLKQIGAKRMELLSTEALLVINALYRGRPLAKNLRPCLKRLTEMGIVEQMGSNKYVLARGLYAAAGKAGVHTRRVGLDRGTNKELLFRHIREKGSQGAPFKELQQVLPGHNRRQIHSLLDELRREERIYCAGRTSAAKWFIVRLGE